MRVLIDGREFIPIDEAYNGEVALLLSTLFCKLSAEASYDPKTKETQKFAAYCLGDIRALNAILKFKK